MGQKAWAEWSGRLAVAERDGFERVVLPLLRLIWPDLRQAPRLGGWDRKGIDLLVWTDEGPFPCVVQCKGFLVQEFGASQAQQIEESIRAFSESECRAQDYLVVHNRDGRARDLTKRISEQLANLVASGKVKRAEIWDRQQVVKRAFKELEERLSAAVRRCSLELLEHSRGLFQFADCYVADVPMIERTMKLQRDKSIELGVPIGPTVRSPRAALEHASGTRWFVLTGNFGSGKTTSVLETASVSERPIVFVPCQTVPTQVFKGGSTNVLTQHVVDQLSLLDDVDDADRLELRRAAGSVLSYLLRKPASPFLFVLDGLDEHHFLSSHVGLERLSNQLAEFSCPVVLTTRREHLEASFGDFGVAFSDLGKKFGASREATLFYLELWQLAQTLKVVDHAVSRALDSERSHLLSFAETLRRDGAHGLYGDLVLHPLFLQFILEDVAERGVFPAPRHALIQRWVARKIRRDLAAIWAGSVESRVQVSLMDVTEYIHRILRAMRAVAYEMTTDTGRAFQLLESMPSSRVTGCVASAFGGDKVDVLPLLLTSVLTTLGPRRSVDVQLGFALRVLHEYFLAAHIAASGMSTDRWPQAVASLVDEIRGDDGRSPSI